MAKDPTHSTEEAVMLLYQNLRSGEAPAFDIAYKFIDKMFFQQKNMTWVLLVGIE